MVHSFCLSGCDKTEPPEPVVADPHKIDDAGVHALVEHTPGTLPIIIVVSHDGQESLEGVPARLDPGNTGRFSTARDRYTRDFAAELADALVQETGRRPHLIVNLLSRRTMDANREPGAATQHPHAAAVYDAFHRKIREVIDGIGRSHQEALLLDIHGQTRHPADVYVITHGGRTLTSLRDRFGETVHSGSSSVGDHLSNSGFAVPPFSREIVTHWLLKEPQTEESRVPLPPLPPFEKPYGYLIQRVGSHQADGINAIQLEVHRRIRYTPDRRRALARTIAEVLIAWNTRFLKPR